MPGIASDADGYLLHAGELPLHEQTGPPQPHTRRVAQLLTHRCRSWKVGTGLDVLAQDLQALNHLLVGRHSGNPFGEKPTFSFNGRNADQPIALHPNLSHWQ